MQDVAIDNFEQSKYFTGGCWGRYLEIIPQTCRYAEGCILVTGELGTGKTTLIQALNETLGQEYNCLNLQGNQEETSTSVVQAVASLVEAQGTTKDTIIFVDDVHAYDDTALLSLLELCASSKQHSKVRLVMFAECEFEPKLQNIREKSGIDSPLHHFDIAPFTATELEAYLWFVWKEKASEKSPSLNSDVIDKISLYTGGVVGKARVLAKKVLQGEKIAMKSITQDDNKTRNSNALVGGFIIFSALLVMFFGVSLKSAPDKTSEVTVALDVKSDLDKAHTKAASLAQMEHSDPDNNMGDVSRDTASDNAPMRDLAVNETIAVPESALTQEQDTEQHSSEATFTPKPQSLQLIKRTNAFRSDEEKLLKAAANKYALQIVANSSKDRMLAFIKTNNLGKEAKVYESTMGEKNWFVLIYGEYETVAQANAALAKLNKTVNQHKPWVRKLDSIQNSIVKARERRS